MGLWSDLTGATGARLARESRSLIGDARGGINASYDRSIGALNSADARGETWGVAARDAWEPVRASGERYNNAGNVLLSSLGVTDPAIAASAFRASPGYAFRVDQATDAAARRANSLGIGPSGNTLSALATLGSNLADQEYSGWQQQLMGVAGLGAQQTGQAAAGQAGAYTNLGNMAQQYGQNVVGVEGNTQRLMADNTRQMAETYGQEAQALGAGAANTVGLGTGLLRMAAGPLGTFLGGGYQSYGGGAAPNAGRATYTNPGAGASRVNWGAI
jgi:hypothetical protein